MAKHISVDKKNEIIEYYKSKAITIDELADHFNLSSPTISKILDQYKIKRYTKSQLFSPNLIQDYFSNIDTEKKAYFLGLIITDGCIHATKGKQPQVTITLAKEDSYLLSDFLNEIKCNKKVTTDGRGCSEIAIYSKQMVSDLKKYSVNERKSLNTVFPKNIDTGLYSHLIRGLIDGDGSISFYSRINQNGRHSHTKAIRLCQGNEKFLLDVVDALYEQCGADKINTYKEKESLWSIAYRKNDSMVKIINYLYKDATIYMKRKKHCCDLILNEICKLHDNTEITFDRNKSKAS